MSCVRLCSLKSALILEVVNMIWLLPNQSFGRCKKFYRFLNLMVICSLLLIGLNDSQNQLFVDVSAADRHWNFLKLSLMHHLAKLRPKLWITCIDRLEIRDSAGFIYHAGLIVDLKGCSVTWSPLVLDMVHLTLAGVVIQGDSNVWVECLTYWHWVFEYCVIVAIGLWDEMIEINWFLTWVFCL